MSTGGSIPAAAAFSGRALLGLAALLGAAGCTSINATAATFEGTRWQVTAINGRSMPATDMYRVQFQDARIGGRFGCNHFGGSYRVERDRLIADDIASTLIGCPEPAGTHEAQGFAVLGQPMRMEWESARRLTLSNPTGSIKLEMVSPE